MLNVLFDCCLKNSQQTVDILNRYAKKIHSLEFHQASQLIDICLESIETEYKQSKVVGDEARLNELYIIRQFLLMLQDYSLYWDKILDHKFIESWTVLQDIQDKLRIVKRYSNKCERAHLDLIEEQVISVEKLYPYKIFASPELIISDVTCSICGKNMESLECLHIRGKLYGGEMAYGIVGRIETVKAICLVEHPVDKRCVIQLKDAETSFPSVSYLANMIRQGRSPWQFASVEETTKQKKISDFGRISRNDECPCGSGKKLKYCCMKIGYVEIPHLEILVRPSKIPSF